MGSEMCIRDSSLSIREALTEEVDYNAEVQGLDFDDLGDAPADDAE